MLSNYYNIARDILSYKLPTVWKINYFPIEWCCEIKINKYSRHSLYIIHVTKVYNVKLFKTQKVPVNTSHPKSTLKILQPQKWLEKYDFALFLEYMWAADFAIFCFKNQMKIPAYQSSQSAEVMKYTVVFTGSQWRSSGLLVSALHSRLSGQRWVLARVNLLCSWARHLTPPVPLSTQVSKWVLRNLTLGVALAWWATWLVLLYLPLTFDKPELAVSTPSLFIKSLNPWKSLSPPITFICSEQLKKEH